MALKIYFLPSFRFHFMAKTNFHYLFVFFFPSLDRCGELTSIPLVAYHDQLCLKLWGPLLSLSLSAIGGNTILHVNDATSHTLLPHGSWTVHNKPRSAAESNRGRVKSQSHSARSETYIDCEVSAFFGKWSCMRCIIMSFTHRLIGLMFNP